MAKRSAVNKLNIIVILSFLGNSNVKIKYEKPAGAER